MLTDSQSACFPHIKLSLSYHNLLILGPDMLSYQQIL